MKKQKIVLVTLLIAVFSACCAMLAACGGEKYAITWDYDAEQVVVTADGYKELPTELADGKEVSFTVTAKEGYEVVNVTPTSSVKKQDDGSYKFTVDGKELKIKINSWEIVNSLTVTDENPHYAGQTIAEGDIKVVADFALQGEKEVTGYSVTYQNGEAFTLGDTGYKVTFQNANKNVEFDTAVEGLVTLNLVKGTIDADALEAALPGAVQDAAAGVVTWTFAEALENDITLPEPTRKLVADDGEIELPFERWSGVDDNKIPAGTDTSVTATAVYTTELVTITKMEFTTKEGVPYLVITGEFKLANSVYLHLCNNNPNENIAYDEDTTVTKQDGSNEFTLEFDLATYAQATPVVSDSNLGEAKKDSFLGSWMDIRFCVTVGSVTLQQELFISDDTNYASLGDEVVAKIGDKYYRFYYESYHPEKGHLITGGDGAEFTGEESILKLVYNETDPYMVNGISLEKKNVEGNEVAYFVIEGTYIGPGADADAVKAAIEDLHTYIQNNDALNQMGWDTISGDEDGSKPAKEVVVTRYAENNSTFKVYLSLEEAVHGNILYAHFTNNKSDGSNWDNLSTNKFDATPVQIDNLKYYLAMAKPWGSDLLHCFVEDVTMPKTTVDSVTFSVESAKVYYVITGTYANLTADDFANVSIDFEPNTFAGSSGDTVVLDSGKVTVTVNNGTYIIKGDVTDLEAKTYWVHALNIPEQGEKLDVSASDYGNNGEFTCNGKKYEYAYQWYETWGTQAFVVTAVS